MLYFSDGVYISYLRNMYSEKDLCLAINWQITPNFLQRGIHTYDPSGFISFTLETFNLLIKGDRLR
ncbi:DUF3598 family protein [Chlorogloeopsis sp. ULAP01]|nr:DUF3598 family protein [Chlorogloeopsis sp. ULAP01]MDM9381227.1 DUF3598 family protein [Chlorogloeopsis sp. ULAP01]